ncbi:MAG: cupin domain-containing protein [Candidatus Eremiobacteraeota bacterium]|nr:cupin domain-containing protein [Candidatus Eremiobacteraeota bacterium]
MADQKKHSRAMQAAKDAKVSANGMLVTVGRILKRMRTQRSLTIRDVARSSGLSASFLSAVERGESDIALGRLTRIAEFFDHDIGSLLGYSDRSAHPNFVTKEDRTLINRGRGVRYESVRLPGLNFELEFITFAPKSKFKDELSHEGIDVLLVTEGDLTLVVDGVDYPMQAGACAVFSAHHPHKVRNDSSLAATAVGFTTGRMA